MKIESVEAWWLHYDIPPEKQHFNDAGQITSFDTVLVRVRTDDGIVGHGEAKVHAGSFSRNNALAAAINGELGPAILGQDPRDVTRLWETLYNGSRVGHAMTRGHGFPIVMRRGIMVSGIAGIDMALWDILGQSLGVPVSRLLGGKCRDRFPTYASGGWAPAVSIGEQLQGYIDRGGFRAVKMRVGAGDGNVAHSIRRVQAARNALGPDIDIMCDAHGTFTVAEARRFCRRVADCDLAWLEEPVSPDNKPGCAEVRAATDIPIATGERESTRFDVRDLIELKAVDILQPDIAICGGITEARRIAAMASAYDIRLAPHLWGGAVLFAASMQFAAATPNAYIIEYSLGTNPMLHELVENPPVQKDGFIEVSDEPGIGVRINENFVRRYAVAGPGTA